MNTGNNGHAQIVSLVPLDDTKPAVCLHCGDTGTAPQIRERPCPASAFYPGSNRRISKNEALRRLHAQRAEKGR